MTVAQWHRNQNIRGLWLLAKKELKMDSCLRGAILNLFKIAPQKQKSIVKNFWQEDEAPWPTRPCA
jgi:hypothetical protein